MEETMKEGVPAARIWLVDRDFEESGCWRAIVVFGVTVLALEDSWICLVLDCPGKDVYDARLRNTGSPVRGEVPWRYLPHSDQFMSSNRCGCTWTSSQSKCMF